MKTNMFLHMFNHSFMLQGQISLAPTLKMDHLRVQICFQSICQSRVGSGVGVPGPASPSSRDAANSLSLTIESKQAGTPGRDSNSGAKLRELRVTERGQEEQKLAGAKTADGDGVVRTNQPPEQQANSPGARRWGSIRVKVAARGDHVFTHDSIRDHFLGRDQSAFVFQAPETFASKRNIPFQKRTSTLADAVPRTRKTKAG